MTVLKVTKQNTTPIFIDGAKKISTYKNIEVVPSYMGKPDDQDPSEIIMATFAQGKPLHANPTIFQDIRKKAINRISEAQKVEIIGVHRPLNKQDDPSLWELFQALRGKKVDFINPSEEENHLAKSLFCFNVIPQSFREFVDSQKVSPINSTKGLTDGNKTHGEEKLSKNLQG